MIFGSGWVCALIWALWPQNSAIADPIIIDATTIQKNSQQETIQPAKRILIDSSRTHKKTENIPPSMPKIKVRRIKI